MRDGVSGFGCVTAIAASLVANAAAGPPGVLPEPPSGSWIVDGDGLHEVRVAYAGPVAVADKAVRVRTARRGFVGGFETRYDQRTGVLEITFTPAIRGDRVSIIVDDAPVDGGRTVLRYLVLDGDVNRDGVVDMRDMGRVVAAVGMCRGDTAFDAAADLDGDGCVGPADAAIVVATLGDALPAAQRSISGPVSPESLPDTLAAEIAVSSGGTPPALTSQARAIYDHGQVGALGPVSVVRDYATRDVLGVAVAAGEPRWGRPQVRAPLQEWTLVRSTVQSISWVAGGFDSNGTDPMLCYFQQGFGTIQFWINVAVSDGNPTFSMNINRGSVRDLLVGSALEQEFFAYEPEAGIVLPGCFLFLCERYYDVNQDVSLRDWQVEGISVVALQRDADGDFALEIIGDGPPLNGDDTALGLARVRPWAMTAYYPVIAGQHPLLHAFIPVVDYINSQGIKKGGQVFLFDATRSDTEESWSFGELFLIDEHVEDDTHFHTAAWTPRGVVVALGDGSARNENILYTCANWDDYTNPFNWMTYDRAYGAGTHPDQPAGTVANQFGGAVPGRDQNHFLVGADVQSGGVFECAVPDDPREGLTFTRLWGAEWSGGDTGGHVALWFHKPAPERSHRSVTRIFPNNLEWWEAIDGARIVYSDDDMNFMTVARLPSSLKHNAFVALHGDDILLFNRAGLWQPQGIWSMPAPVSRGPSRGLSIAPGGTNLLAVDGGGGLIGAAAGGTTTLTLVTDGMHPVTGEPLDAPGLGPIYRVQADASSDQYIEFLPAGAATVASGFVYVPMWFRVIGPEGLVARVQLTDAGGQAGEVARQCRLNSREQWVPFTAMLDNSGFAGDYTPRLRLLAEGAVPRIADFLVMVDGYYAGEPPPYSTAPGSKSPAEQVTQPLGALGESWTVGLELHVPFSSEDWLGHASATQDEGRLYLATIFADDGNYVEISAVLNVQAIRADIYSAGVLVGSMSLPGVAVQRSDRLWIALTQSSGSELVLYAWSGGSMEDGLPGVSSPVGLTLPPIEVRFGRPDFSRVPAMDVLMVAVERYRALGRQGVLQLLSSDGDVTTSLPVADP